MKNANIYRKLCLSILVCLVLTGMVTAEEPRAANSADDDLAFLPAVQLAQKIQAGEISSSRMVDLYLHRIARYNPTINAVVTVGEEGARKRAKEADIALSQGIVWGPLHGVPITIKDNLAVKGMRSTAGYPPLADHIPTEDSVIVRRLKEAGAIILGKTNMPQLGLDNQTFNPIFGTTNNPWDLSRTPGGSSGGCSAAVAAGLTAFSIGNDIGGSIRTPAHFTGVFGIKTTEHFVPGAGTVGEQKDYRTTRHFLTYGPIARSVADIQLVLQIIGGASVADPDVPRVFLGLPERQALRKLRIAWTDQFSGWYVSDESKQIIKSFVEKLEKNGIRVEKIEPSDLDFGAMKSTFFQLFMMENMNDISYFWRKVLCILDNFCISADQRDYLKALSQRDRMISAMDKLVMKYDAWIVPVDSSPAFKHRKPVDYFGPMPRYEGPIIEQGEPAHLGIYTEVFNLTGHPSVVVPAGFTEQGLPVGVQLIGKRWYDMELLTVAEQLAEIAGDYRRPPGFSLTVDN